MEIAEHLPPDGTGPLVNGAVDINRKLGEIQKDRAKIGEYPVARTVARSERSVIMSVKSDLISVQYYLKPLHTRDY